MYQQQINHSIGLERKQSAYLVPTILLFGLFNILLCFGASCLALGVEDRTVRFVFRCSFTYVLAGIVCLLFFVVPLECYIL